MPSVNFILSAASTVGGSGELTRKNHEYQSDMLLHLEMMVLADKYEASGLIERAEEYLTTTPVSDIESFWLLVDKLDELTGPLRGRLEKILVERGHRNSMYVRDVRFKSLMLSHHELAWEIVKNHLSPPLLSPGWGDSVPW